MQKAISSPRILFPEVFVTTSKQSNQNKRPILKLEGKTAELCKQLNICSSHVSISHEEDRAVANVILEESVVVDSH